MEVLTSKGIEKVKTGYWVIFDNQINRYKIRHVLDSKTASEVWNEGIFHTKEEAETRAEQQNNFLDQRHKNKN